MVVVSFRETDRGNSDYDNSQGMDKEWSLERRGVSLQMEMINITIYKYLRNQQTAKGNQVQPRHHFKLVIQQNQGISSESKSMPT